MKQRLDVWMTEHGLAPSREKAKAMIMSGDVYVDGQREDKAGTQIAGDAKVEVKGNALPYVSRGGLKLAKAMEVFPLDLKDCICMDIGASTGGFTDCMLQNGAAKVYSIDVGYGQLAWKLRTDPRVVVLEKTNFRYVTGEQIPEKIDFASVDVSFISLNKIFPAAYPLLADGGQMVALIKPQFEAGKDKVGKKGVVRDPAVHTEVIKRVITESRAVGFVPVGLDFSPVKGPEGNIEYLLHVRKDPDAAEGISKDVIAEDVIVEEGILPVKEVVARAHAQLD